MGIQESIKMQNPAVSPLKGYDNARDKERTTVQAGHQNTSQYAKEAELGELMTEMMTTLLLSKPDAPVDFLIDLLSASRSQRIAVCAPPGVKLESVVKAIANDLGVIVVSVPPLIDEAQERYIEGKTVAEHGAWCCRSRQDYCEIDWR